MSQQFIRKNDRVSIPVGTPIWTRKAEEPWTPGGNTQLGTDKLLVAQRGIVKRTIPAATSKSLSNMPERPRLVVVIAEDHTGSPVETAYPASFVRVVNDGRKRNKRGEVSRSEIDRTAEPKTMVSSWLQSLDLRPVVRWATGDPKRQLFLVGPPSTGKSLLARALEIALNATFDVRDCGSASETQGANIVCSNADPGVVIGEGEFVKLTKRVNFTGIQGVLTTTADHLRELIAAEMRRAAEPKAAE